LGRCMTLIGRQFVILSSLGFILHHAPPVRKTEDINILGVCIILIGSEFEVSSRFN
jgi:hypothetical protein